MNTVIIETIVSVLANHDHLIGVAGAWLVTQIGKQQMKTINAAVGEADSGSGANGL